jgi:hypothetical protein
MPEIKPPPLHPPVAFFDLPPDSVPKTIVVAVSLCLVASMVVSAAAVLAAPGAGGQQAQGQADQHPQVAGLYEPGVDVGRGISRCSSRRCWNWRPGKSSPTSSTPPPSMIARRRMIRRPRWRWRTTRPRSGASRNSSPSICCGRGGRHRQGDPADPRLRAVVDALRLHRAGRERQRHLRPAILPARRDAGSRGRGRQPALEIALERQAARRRRREICDHRRQDPRRRRAKSTTSTRWPARR